MASTAHIEPTNLPAGVSGLSTPVNKKKEKFNEKNEMSCQSCLTVSDGGDGEQPPPEAVHEAPLVVRVLLLREVDQAGEGEHHDEDEGEE